MFAHLIAAIEAGVAALDRNTAALERLHEQEGNRMSVEQDLTDAVTALTASVGTIITDLKSEADKLAAATAAAGTPDPAIESSVSAIKSLVSQLDAAHAAVVPAPATPAPASAEPVPAASSEAPAATSETPAAPSA